MVASAQKRSYVCVPSVRTSRPIGSTVSPTIKTHKFRFGSNRESDINFKATHTHSFTRQDGNDKKNKKKMFQYLQIC